MPRPIYPVIVRRTTSGGGGAAFTDSVSLNIKIADSMVAPTDVASFLLRLAQADSFTAPTETLKLNILGLGDAITAPTDTALFTARVWLSATTMRSTNGVTNPANMDSDGATTAVFQSAVLGDANPRTDSVLGANIPSAAIISAAIIRGWFQSANTLITSLGKLTLHSLTAAFTDQIIFSNAGLATTVNHLGGTFTYDLIANGINTLAKLQSIQFLASTADAVAGVTPHVLTFDKLCVELAGAFT